jgi:hypothetical protein
VYCLFTAVGYIVQGYFQLPDPVFQEGKAVNALIKVRRSCFAYSCPIPDPLTSHSSCLHIYTTLPQVATQRPEALVQIGLAIAALEVLGASIQKYTAPGDLKFDPLGIKPTDEEVGFWCVTASVPHRCVYAGIRSHAAS